LIVHRVQISSHALRTVPLLFTFIAFKASQFILNYVPGNR
jgi:hypothetical protein